VSMWRGWSRTLTFPIAVSWRSTSLARSVLVLGHTTAFVVRNFKHKRIDEWWQRLRGQEGTRVIDRTGAALKMLRLIKSGTDVGVLFDQNVTRKNALFIDHFGRPAATTKSVAYTAVTTQCIVLFISLRYVGNDRYCIDLTEIPVQDVYHDSSLTAEEKMHEITVRATRELERRILAQPEGWFWMHRRWKTTPEGVPEDFYR
jgi:Kdo2-lipid IVA lauroyltransferase/acyltransferase